MPVIVIGADTPAGESIISALLARGGEVRSFVTNPSAGAALKATGLKVAIGDLSDVSHIGTAAHHVFTAVLIEEAVADGRLFALAPDEVAVLDGWRRALQDAGVQRAIWVGTPPAAVVDASAPEVAVIDPTGRTTSDLAREVADLNDRETLESGR